jgi:pyruvate-formate lyase
MFRALLAHLQEALHKQHLVYCVRVMSVGCTRVEAEATTLVQPADITRTQYTKCCLFSAS